MTEQDAVLTQDELESLAGKLAAVRSQLSDKEASFLQSALRAGVTQVGEGETTGYLMSSDTSWRPRPFDFPPIIVWIWPRSQ